jgi:nitrogen fixation protein NifU and related proteins
MLDQLYQEIILDHYKRPHGRGLREPFDAEVRHVNPTCGDEVALRVRLDADGGRVADVSYDSVGCSISQASASVLHELVSGGSVADALTITGAFTDLMTGRGDAEPDEEVLGDGVAFAGVARYPARVKCALLPWMALKDALARAVPESVASRDAAADAGSQEAVLTSPAPTNEGGTP